MLWLRPGCVVAKRSRSSVSAVSAFRRFNWQVNSAPGKFLRSTSIPKNSNSPTVQGDLGRRLSRRSRRTNSGNDQRSWRRCGARIGWVARYHAAGCPIAGNSWSGRSGWSHREKFEIAPYRELLNKEAEIIGVSDHLASEIPILLELARTGKLDLSHGIIRTVPLDAQAINDALDGLENFGNDVRVVIVP